MRRLIFFIILCSWYFNLVLAYPRDLLQVCKKSPDDHQLYPKGDYLDTLILLEEVLVNTVVFNKFCQDGLSLDYKILEQQPCINNSQTYSGIYLYNLRKNKYLLSITCAQGAYNQSDLYFIYDTKLAQNERYLPDILIFPAASADKPDKFFNTITVNTRLVDTKRGLIHHLSKDTGLGYSGEYIKYKLNKNTFVPGMSKFVYNADYIEDGDYGNNEITDEPEGKQWKTVNFVPAKMGCIMPLKKLLAMPPKELDNIKCN